MQAGRLGCLLVGALVGLLVPRAEAAESAAVTTEQPCRLPGLAQAAVCGGLARPLDPSRPQGTQIQLHYARLPAQSPRPLADPVLFFAGGPGQSAISLAPLLAGAWGRLNQRRDLVFVDQRGTGRSAPLVCPDDDPKAPPLPLAEQLDSGARLARLVACRRQLQALPHGDLRFYTTALAAADVDALRAALGVDRINAIGVSYGTRVVLDYQRQFPQRLRRAVLDGVVPPDMRLADSAGADNQAALNALLATCAADATCERHHPDLAGRWRQLLASLPRTVSLPDPLTGRPQAVRLDRDALLGLVRPALYLPALAAALPAALSDAAQDRWAALGALAGALDPGAGGALATGMHLSVVCSEDLALAAPTAQAGSGAGAVAAAGTAGTEPNPADQVSDFGDSFVRQYRQACAAWPRGSVSAGFAQVGSAVAPMWLLSGGLDPVTPPRHGQRMAAALGARARHTVVAQAGHGVANLPCMRDAVQRFITLEDDAAALALAASTACAADMPRPPAFVLPGWGSR